MWQVANDTPVWMRPRRTIYFLVRTGANGRMEYLRDKRGRLRTWQTRDAAAAAAARKREG